MWTGEISHLSNPSSTMGKSFILAVLMVSNKIKILGFLLTDGLTLLQTTAGSGMCISTLDHEIAT